MLPGGVGDQLGRRSPNRRTASIGEQLAVHPDSAVFTSLPRSGTALACLAGVAPSTRQSGKVKAVIFRWGADKQPRDALCDFAADTRHVNPWAAQLYDQARARGHDHPHAVRILARAWVGGHLALRADNTPYDPAGHGALQHLLQHDQTKAA